MISVRLKVIRQVSLRCAGRSEPPLDVRVVSCVADFVDLIWVTSGDNNSPILYIVYYTDSSAEDPEELVVGSRLSARRQSSTPGTIVPAVIPTRPWVQYRHVVGTHTGVI